MTAQESLKAFADRKPNAGASAQLVSAFSDQVIANMRAAPDQARIGLVLFGCALAQVDGELCNLQFGAIGVRSKMRNGVAIEFAALKIHALVSFGRIGRQHPLEDDQRLQQIFPGRFRQLAQATDQVAHPLRLGRRSQNFLGPVGEFFQRHQFQRRDQERELTHVETGHGLERFHVGSESAVRIAISRGIEQVLGDGQHSRKNHVGRSAHMRNAP